MTGIDTNNYENFRNEVKANSSKANHKPNNPSKSERIKAQTKRYGISDIKIKYLKDMLRLSISDIKIKYLKDMLRLSILKNYIFIFLLIGMTLNFVAIANNNGLMPVYDKYSENITFTSNQHIAFTPETKHTINKFYFTDIFTIGKTHYSIGDFIMYFSLIFILSITISEINIIIKYKKFRKLHNIEW